MSTAVNVWTPSFVSWTMEGPAEGCPAKKSCMYLKGPPWPLGGEVDWIGGSLEAGRVGGYLEVPALRSGAGCGANTMHTTAESLWWALSEALSSEGRTGPVSQEELRVLFPKDGQSLLLSQKSRVFTLQGIRNCSFVLKQTFKKIKSCCHLVFLGLS